MTNLKQMALAVFLVFTHREMRKHETAVCRTARTVV